MRRRNNVLRRSHTRETVNATHPTSDLCAVQMLCSGLDVGARRAHNVARPASAGGDEVAAARGRRVSNDIHSGRRRGWPWDTDRSVCAWVSAMDECVSVQCRMRGAFSAGRQSFGVPSVVEAVLNSRDVESAQDRCTCLGVSGMQCRGFIQL